MSGYRKLLYLVVKICKVDIQCVYSCVDDRRVPQCIFGQLDVDHDGDITEEEFVKVTYPLPPPTLPPPSFLPPIPGLPAGRGDGKAPGGLRVAGSLTKTAVRVNKLKL